MVKERKTFFHNEQQHGGMLLELMLVVAISALLIPFISRYQKNTIERARNIAVVKQMEIVQRALENCIEANQIEFMKPTHDYIYSNPAETECLALKQGAKGLIQYGLSDNFATDYQNDYMLRILKTNDSNGAAVLQGVVLLKNNGITALRTREIIDVGGGKLGYTKNNTVYGGYGAFTVSTPDIGLSGQDGIVEMTSAIRGKTNNQYLWRKDNGVTSDAAMLSDLNLGGHSINKIAEMSGNNNSNSSISGYCGQASLDGTQPLISASNVTFKGTASFGNTNIGSGGTSAVINNSNDVACPLTGTGSNSNLFVSGNGKAVVNGDLYTENYTTKNINIIDTITVNNFEEGEIFNASGNVKFRSLNPTKILFTGDYLKVNKIDVTSCVISANNESYYYNAKYGISGCGKDFSASLYDVKIPGLGKKMKTIYERENSSSYTTCDNFKVPLISEQLVKSFVGGIGNIEREATWENITVGQFLELLDDLQDKINEQWVQEVLKLG